MSLEKIINTIEHYHKTLYVPYISRLEINGVEKYGYFMEFDDSIELKTKGLYRFITNGNWQLYQTDIDKRRTIDPTAKGDIKYSEVLDVRNIKDISVVSYRKVS